MRRSERGREGENEPEVSRVIDAEPLLRSLGWILRSQVAGGPKAEYRGDTADLPNFERLAAGKARSEKGDRKLRGSIG